METKSINNAKLGLFVIAGFFFLVLTLYMIGRNRNILGSTFNIAVKMENVNGLLPGNNVRFRGIDVGTVRSVAIVDDTSIYVTLTIKKKFKGYIRKNAMASIGTDGLMGNKLVNINSRPGHADAVESGSVLTATPPVETDEMLRTLNTTNNNIAVITRNLQQITDKLNRSNSLWSLLGDTSIAVDLKNAVRDIRTAGRRTAEFTGEAAKLVQEIRSGEGLAGALLTDSTLREQLATSLAQIESGSADLSALIANMNTLIGEIQNGNGTAGQVISDTTLRNRLLKTIVNAEQGTARFSENMEALKHNFFFRRYFMRQEKKKKK